MTNANDIQPGLPDTALISLSNSGGYVGRILARISSILLALIFPLALLVLWQIAADRGWVAEQILPAPAVVYASFLDLVDSGELLGHLTGSLERVAIAYALAAGVGITFGVALGLSPTLESFLAPLFEAYAQTPVIAWIPIGLLLFGISESLAVALICIAAFVPIAMNTFQGVRHIPATYFEVASVYRFNAWQLLSKVVFPAALPAIVVGLRYGLTQAWLTLVAGELIGVEQGLGALLVQARNLFQLDIVMVVILTLGIVGLALDKVFVWCERRLLHWRKQGF